jgi:hypothetical protein
MACITTQVAWLWAGLSGWPVKLGERIMVAKRFDVEADTSALERDKKFVAEQKLTEDADEVFVNGDSFIRNAKALEPVFKARMFAEVQA